METSEVLDREINVPELLRATKEPPTICFVGEPRPVYSQGPDGRMYSCAMSTVDRQQGYINGIPYTSMSLNGINNVAIGDKALLQGCCANIALGCVGTIDPDKVIHINPDIQKG
jgi:hypothetical protein